MSENKHTIEAYFYKNPNGVCIECDPKHKNEDDVFPLYGSELKKQRDELLEMLEKVTEKLAWLNSDDCGHIMDLTDKAEALVASVKGGAA